MAWIFNAFLVVSLVHVVEEYFLPGGFMNVMKRFNPRFAPLITAPMAVVINGLQLVLCVLAMIVGEGAPVFSLSVAALLYLNGCIHVFTALRLRGYAPGLVSGALLYIPLAAFSYAVFISLDKMNLAQVLISAALGVLYQVVPVAYLAIAGAVRQRSLAR